MKKENLLMLFDTTEKLNENGLSVLLNIHNTDSVNIMVDISSNDIRISKSFKCHLSDCNVNHKLEVIKEKSCKEVNVILLDLISIKNNLIESK